MVAKVLFGTSCFDLHPEAGHLDGALELILINLLLSAVICLVFTLLKFDDYVFVTGTTLECQISNQRLCLGLPVFKTLITCRLI